MKNPESKDEIYNSIIIYAELNPKLIYFYIEHLNFLQEPNSQSNTVKIKNNIFDEARRSRYLKSLWAQSEINSIKHQESIFSDYDNEIRSYFVRYIDEKNYDLNYHSPEIDTNLSNFFCYVYLAEKLSDNFNLQINPDLHSLSSYDSSINYFDLIDKLAEKLQAKYHSFFNSIEIENLEVNIEFIKNIIPYSYLLFDYFSYGLTSKSNIKISELIEKIFSEYYLNSKSIYFTTGLSFYTHFNEIYDRFNFGNIYDKKIKLAGRYLTEQFLSIGFTQPLRKYRGMLSRISVALNISIKSNVSPAATDTLLFRGAFSSLGNYFNGEIRLLNISSKYIAWGASVTTPVYFINPNHYFEIGVNYIYQKVDYKFENRILGEIRISQPTFLPKEEDYFYTSNVSRVYPSITYNLNLLNTLKITVSVLIPKVYSAGIGCYVDL